MDRGRMTNWCLPRSDTTDPPGREDAAPAVAGLMPPNCVNKSKVAVALQRGSVRSRAVNSLSCAGS